MPVTRVGFGTGGLLRIDRVRERQSVLAAALASGVTHFDTAPTYGFGESERVLGRFLQQKRHRVTITTKFGLRPSGLAKRLVPLQQIARRALRALPMLHGAAARNSGALYAPPSFSVVSVRESLEASLRALRTDYVDFFLAHEASAEALPAEDVIDLLQELRRAGKIRAFGVATPFNRLMPVLHRRPQLSQVMQFDSEVLSSHVSGVARNADQLVITYSFIARGVAACRERLSNSRSGMEGLERAGDDTLGGLLLRAAVLANPHGMVLMQSRSTERIAHNVRAASTSEQDDSVQRLVDLLRNAR